MQPGRTPNWNVVAESEGDTWFEAVEAASGGRLPLPAALRNRLDWGTPTASLPLLATIEADAGVLVAPMSARRDEVARVRAALGSSDPQDRSALTFAAMATYSRVSLQPDGRLRLSPTLSRHLGVADGGGVWVGAHGGVVRLWSEGAWREVLGRTSALLREAVGRSRSDG